MSRVDSKPAALTNRLKAGHGASTGWAPVEVLTVIVLTPLVNSLVGRLETILHWACLTIFHHSSLHNVMKFLYIFFHFDLVVGRVICDCHVSIN
jgi:hypothetical protein